MAKLDELRKDLLEVEQLLQSAKRLRTQELLKTAIENLKQEITTLEAKAASSSHSSVGHYVENVTNYAWDQSDKFMKLYLSLSDLADIKDSAITSSFTDRSVTVKVTFTKKTSQLHIARLCEDIIPEESYIKKKSDYVLVMLKKVEAGKTWPWVTEREKKAKETKSQDKSKHDEAADPSAGIMSMMKNMYEEGDDEMKRTISKAFYESQMKQMSGGADPLAGM